VTRLTSLKQNRLESDKLGIPGLVVVPVSAQSDVTTIGKILTGLKVANKKTTLKMGQPKSQMVKTETDLEPHQRLEPDA